MPSDWIVYACLTAGLASALVAGVFQSFSDFVMRSLVAARPAAGAEAMQQINRKVFRSAFIAMLLGLAPVSLAFAAYAWTALDGVPARFLIVGAALYLSTVIGVTVAGNVPMNERLDRLDVSGPEGERYWRIYGVAWTRLNHVRTLGALAAALCFLLAALALA